MSVIGQIKDIAGQKFGRLTALEFDHLKETASGYRIAVWKCVCDCQLDKPEDEREYVYTPGTYLRIGQKKSCGCLNRETTTKRHGLSHTPFYCVWVMMRQRCNNPTNKDYEDYGKRGIGVCERWEVFENFYDDMWDGYSPGLELDRIDNSKGYYKENCRWTDRSGNMRNTRRNHLVDSPWGVICLQEFCERVSNETNVKPSTIRGRIDRGELPEDICEKYGIAFNKEELNGI